MELFSQQRSANLLCALLLCSLATQTGGHTGFASAAEPEPIVGVWSSISDGYSWSIEISAQSDSRGTFYRGVYATPLPFHKTGEEGLIIRATSLPGVYEGRQKWKNALRISSWYPTRIVMNGGNVFTEYNSLPANIPLRMSTTWTYIRNARQGPQISNSTNVSPNPPANPSLDSTGSGFVINRAGQVLTNYHVVSGCSAIGVRVGQDKLSATVQASDATNDLAILNTNRTTASLNSVRAF